MANGTFNSLGNAYGRDPVSENQQLHQARRARDEYDARVTGFIDRELAGRSFHSLKALLTAACKAGVSRQRRGLGEERHAAFERSCRAIWCGLALRADLGRDYSTRDGLVTIYAPQDRNAA
jgi:hypothetical protein